MRNFPRQDARQTNNRVHFGNTSVATTQGFYPEETTQQFENPMTFQAASYHISNVEAENVDLVMQNGGDQESATESPNPTAVKETLPIAMMAKELQVETKEGELVNTTVFFDSGSDRSYISEKLASKLKLNPLDSKCLHLQTFADTAVKKINANRFSVSFHVKEQKITIPLIEMKSITKSITVGHIDELTIKKLFEDADVIMPRSNTEPDILIGLDSMTKLLGDTESKALPNGTTIHFTDCGPMVTGTEITPKAVLDDTSGIAMDYSVYHTLEKSGHAPIGIFQTCPDEQHAELKTLLERFWHLESSLIFDNPKTTDDELTAKFFEETTTRDADGRYVCRWPFREGKESLPDNRHLAYYRLISTINRLNKDPELYKKYEDIIKDQENRGFIEIVNEKEHMQHGKHYISHHPIIKPTSTSTKVRIVYDASARSTKQSKSFNDILFTGESLLPKLLGVILRVRQPAILVSCDLEKAFLQLGLHEEDRDFCRFLWKPKDSEGIICYRFKRVPFGVKSSPYLLNATINLHLNNVNNSLAKEMQRNLYVDNIFKGVETVEEGIQFYKDSRKIFHDAKMHLTQFVTNCDQLNTAIAKKEENAKTQDCEQKLLGIQWNTTNDVLLVTVAKPISSSPLSKRKILQSVATTYDPMGFISPVSLQGKLFFQLLWAHSNNWDARLTTEEEERWKIIEADCCGEPITVARQYFSSPTTPNHKMELHVFGDASESAYGSVAYLRRIGTDGIQTSLVASKSKVAPLKKSLTIPQLELMAIERCAQMGHTLQEELDMKIKKTIIWSDSLCNLDKIASDKGDTVFVRNRLRTIHRHLPSAIFSHVQGRLNPADVLSRGCSLNDLRNHELWWKGPSFLHQEKLPIRESSIQSAITFACMIDQINQSTVLNLDPHRFSSFPRMMNVVIRMLRLTVKDETQLKDKAKKVLIKLAQQLHPPDESTIKNLKLQKENDIWFYIGRMPDRKLPFLPNHRIAKLFTQAIHLQQKHSSPMHTHVKVREEVWIPKGLSFVQKAIRECLICKKIKLRHIKQPDFPMLPDSRKIWTKPFTHCGLDYCGPIQAVNNGEIRKYWIILITCHTSRYTVVELTPSLDAVNLLRVIRRFCSQYGTPKEILTDNAAQIVMLSAVTKEAQKQISSMVLHQELPVFKFIPALSPWAGGIYERMVALIKNCLIKAGTTKSVLEEEDLRTLIKEAEAVVNDRPLTYAGQEDIQPIRPIDFVFPNKRSSNLLKVDETMDTTAMKTSHAMLLDNWIHMSILTEQFIKRWKTEYLQVLQARTQTTHQQDRFAEAIQLRIGDIVLIESADHKLNWPLGRIVEIQPRSAKIFCPRTKQIVERLLKKIFLLEECPQESQQKDKATNHDSTSKDDQYKGPMTRSRNKSKSIEQHVTSVISTTPKFTHGTITMLTLIALSIVAPKTEARVLESTSSLATTGNNSIVTEFYQWLLQMIMITGSIIFFSALLHVIIQGIQCIKNTFKYAKQALKLIGLVMCCRTSKNTPGIIILGVLLASSYIKCCNDVAHIQANERACYDRVNASECHINSVSLITVKANGSKSCLEIQHANNEPLATLKITADSLINYCNKRTVYFSRDFTLTHEYVRKCDEAGSCSIERCGKIQPDEDLPELSKEAKSRPGYTSCEQGCGGWHCSCFYYNPSCLFNRVYAIPSSNDIYEIYTCPSWTPRLRISIELGKLQISTELSPGTKYTLPNSNISITAIGLTTPPLQVHSSTFIAAYGIASNTPKWTSFSFTPPASPGTPSRGFTGELQCTTRDDAEKFNCVFDRSLCKCKGFATTVNCQCQNRQMADYQKKNKLPSKGVNQEVLIINNLLATVAIQETTVSLQVEIRNASITRMTSVMSCFARQQGPLEGCHSCFEGGSVPIVCTSPKKVTAIIHCGIIETSMECGPTPTTTSIQIASSTPDVNLNCTVDCGQRTHLTIEGALETQLAFETNTTFYSSAFEKIVSSPLALGNFIIDFGRVFINQFSHLIILIGLITLLFFSCLISRRILSHYLGISRRTAKLKARAKYY